MLSTDIDISQWVIASGFLIVLLFLFAYALRYISHKQPQTAFGMKRKRMRLVETLHLDARSKICIIEMDNTEVILAVSASGFETIATQEKLIKEELPLNTTTETHTPEIGNFLKKFIQKKNCCEEKIKSDKKKVNR